ncbi:flippase [Clostridium perfringens]|uniref:flippase n=1 Tax=Clostridium perfringens TaxID=1502 RepID=UPI001CCFF846|nr:flippase [Clostridium perfringens]UBK35299.1 flippase [Clostridium perfringens]
MEKSLTKNAVFNVLYKALSVLFPLITISYASHILGPDGIGLVSSAQNFVTYFIMFSSLGIPAYGVRAIARLKDNKIDCNKTFTELFLINVISTLLCTIIYYFIINTNNNVIINYKISTLFGSLVIFNIFNIDWLYQGFEEYKFIAIRSFGIKVISLFLLILFVKKSDDIFYYALILCLGSVGNYILNIIQLNKFIHFDFNNINIKQHLKPIFIFFFTVIAIELYSLIDITMLTRLKSLDNVGYYSNASKIVKTLASTITAIGAVLMPRLSYYYYSDRHEDMEKIINKTFKVILLISIPACVGLIFTSKLIVNIMFGIEFMPTAKTICLLSPLIIFIPISAGIGSQILQTTNNEKKSLICVVIGSICNLILNFILIPIYSENGAAIASVITEVMVTIMMLVYSRRIIRAKIQINFITSIILSVIVMSISIFTFINSSLFKSTSINCLISIILGSIIYFSMLFITKNEILLEFIKK